MTQRQKEVDVVVLGVGFVGYIVARARTETASRTAPRNGDAELAALK
jgi:hypothetical protein